MMFQAAGRHSVNEWSVRQLPRVPSMCSPGASRYTVVRGDTMFLIAQRLQVDLNELIAANPHIPNPGSLMIGDVLCIPRRQGAECPPGADSYIVQPGDTMIAIAQRFGVTLQALLAANPQIENPNRIFPGDIVCIPTIDMQLLPCCVYLSVRELEARGSALIEQFGRLGQFSVGALVEDLPDPSEFGNFDSYLLEVVVPNVDVYQTELFPVVNEPTLVAGRLIFSLPAGVSDLSADTRVLIRPLNSGSGELGTVILQGSLQQCAR